LPDRVNATSGLKIKRYKSMPEETQKQAILNEITALLNEHGGQTHITPSVLGFLSEHDLMEIKNSLLHQKEHHLDDKEWLHQFKKEM
jgi:uncharacterized protein YejL (UPF0352 family)